MQDVPRKIIHIDMDAFYASIEQRDNPQLRGKPVVVGGLPDKRGVVAAASYEARKFGIHSAMSSMQAKKRCPNLIFIYPRFDAYKEVSRQIQAIFFDYTDVIEPLSLDEAYLDVTLNKKEMSTASLIAEEIRKRIHTETSLTASAGVSYNKFLAKVASNINKPNGQFVITPQRAMAFLEKLPIGKFYGIGKVTSAKMHERGIHTGADLKRMSEEALVNGCGKVGHFYYQIVRGIDPRPVEPYWERKSSGAENTFDVDLSDLNLIREEIDKLVKEVFAWMVKSDTYGRTLTLKVKYADFQQVTRSRTLLHAIEDEAEMKNLAYELLLKTEAGERKVRLVGVSVSNFYTEEVEKLPVQLLLNL